MHEARRYCPECDRMVLARGPRKDTNHVIHLLLTLVTCGLWAPLWLLDTILSWIHPLRCPTCGRRTNYGVAGGPDRSARDRRFDQIDRERDEDDFREDIRKLARRATLPPPVQRPALVDHDERTSCVAHSARVKATPIPQVTRQPRPDFFTRLGAQIERVTNSMLASPLGQWAAENRAAAYTIAAMWAVGLLGLAVLVAARS